jgi:hypothetical protein
MKSDSVSLDPRDNFLEQDKKQREYKTKVLMLNTDGSFASLRMTKIFLH